MREELGSGIEKGADTVKNTDGLTQKKSPLGKDWTKGNVFHNLLRLSWPMAISNLLMSIGPTIDMIWVGKLGSASVAGVGVAGLAVQIIMVAIWSLMVGMRAMVARFIGAGDTRGPNHVAQQALVVCTVFAVLMAVIGMFFSEAVLGMFGLEDDVVKEGAAYLRILFVGSVVMCIRMMADAGMQASGDVITPMRIAVFYRLFHVALCPFLIFGWWIFPEMGVSGAATTNIISQSMGTALGLWVLFTGRTRLKLSLKGFRLDLNIIWRMVKIGLPALVSGVQKSLTGFIFMWIIAPFGTAAIAAHTISQRIEMFLFMPGMAFGMAAGVMVGQNLGAQKPERAEKSTWLAVAIVEGIMIICSVVLLLWAEQIIGIFNQEPELVKIASTFLRIAVVGYSVLAFVAVLMSALSGAGDTIPGMIIEIIATWLISLPLAYFLPKITDLGIYGVRWGLVAGMLASTAAIIVYFRLGRWKRKKV